VGGLFDLLDGKDGSYPFPTPADLPPDSHDNYAQPRTSSILLYKAGGLRNSRQDTSGFSLFELNQINELNLRKTGTHGNGVPVKYQRGGSGSGHTDASPTKGGLGSIAAPTTGDFGGAPLRTQSVDGRGDVETMSIPSGFDEYADKGMSSWEQYKKEQAALLDQRFLGMANLEQRQELPSDTIIAVGRYQIVQAVNNFERIAVYRKSISSNSTVFHEKKQRRQHDHDVWHTEAGMMESDEDKKKREEMMKKKRDLDTDISSAAAFGHDQLNQAGDKRRLIIGPLPFTAIWSGFGGPCERNPMGSHPSLLYDQTSGRFVQLHTTRPSSKHDDVYVCMAVSIDEDATGLYYRYQFNFDRENLLLNPVLSVWPASNSFFATFDTKQNDEHHMKHTGNVELFPSSFTGVVVAGFDRANMLQGQLADARWGQLKNDGVATYHGCLASSQDGFNISPYLDNLIMCLDPRHGESEELDIFPFHANWAGATFALTGPIQIKVPKYIKACDESMGCVAQKGTSTLLTALGSSLNPRLAYRTFFGFDPWTNAGQGFMSKKQRRRRREEEEEERRKKHRGKEPAGQNIHRKDEGPGAVGLNDDKYGPFSGQLGNDHWGSGPTAGGEGAPFMNDHWGSPQAFGHDDGYSASAQAYEPGRFERKHHEHEPKYEPRPVSVGRMSPCSHPYSDGYGHASSWSHHGRVTMDRGESINPFMDSLCTNGHVSFGRVFNAKDDGSNFYNAYGPAVGKGADFGRGMNFGPNQYGNVVSDYATVSHSIYLSKTSYVVQTRWYVLQRRGNSFVVVKYGTITPGKAGEKDKQQDFTVKYDETGRYESHYDVMYDRIDDHYDSKYDSHFVNSAFAASLAMDASGNVGATYTVSGPDFFPQIRFALLPAPFKNKVNSTEPYEDKDKKKDDHASSSSMANKNEPYAGFVPNFSDVNVPNNFNYFDAANPYRDNLFDPFSTHAPNLLPKFGVFRNELIIAKSGGFQGVSHVWSHGWMTMDTNDCFFWLTGQVIPLTTRLHVFWQTIIAGVDSLNCQSTEPMREVGRPMRQERREHHKHHEPFKHGPSAPGQGVGPGGGFDVWDHDGRRQQQRQSENEKNKNEEKKQRGLGDVNLPYNNIGQRPSKSGTFRDFELPNGAYAASGVFPGFQRPDDNANRRKDDYWRPKSANERDGLYEEDAVNKPGLFDVENPFPFGSPDDKRFSDFSRGNFEPGVYGNLDQDRYARRFRQDHWGSGPAAGPGPSTAPHPGSAPSPSPGPSPYPYPYDGDEHGPDGDGPSGPSPGTGAAPSKSGVGGVGGGAPFNDDDDRQHNRDRDAEHRFNDDRNRFFEQERKRRQQRGEQNEKKTPLGDIGNKGGPVLFGGGLLGNAGGNACYDSRGNYICTSKKDPGNPNGKYTNQPIIMPAPKPQPPY